MRRRAMGSLTALVVAGALFGTSGATEGGDDRDAVGRGSGGDPRGRIAALELRVAALERLVGAGGRGRESAEVPVSAAPGRRGQKGGGSKEAAGEELPPALAEMIAQRRADEAEARARALRARDIVLPESAWEELKGRARSLGLRPDLLDAGATFQATIDLAAIAPAAAAG